MASDNILDPNAPAMDSPAANAAPIRVRISNPTGRDAECRVAMELIGREIHFSLRRILTASAALVIGPDRADIVRIEAVFLGLPPAAMEPAVFRMGSDFSPGDTIEFVLALPSDGDGQDDGQGDDQAPPPPPAPTIAIEGRDEDVVINPGELVTFDVVTTDAGPDALLHVLADPDADPENHNEVVIIADAPAADRTTIVWNTTAVPTGTYTILAELHLGDNIISAEPAPGQVIIVVPPPATGACCYPDGTCEILTEAACVLGEWLGSDTDCADCPACLVLCPSDGRAESEPCGEDTNGGCSSEDGGFEPIACDETVCGTVWLEPFSPPGANRPLDPNDPNEFPLDFDWYVLTFMDDTEFTFTVEAEFPVMIALMQQIEPGVAGCDNLDGNALDLSVALECEPAVLSRCVGPGTHYLVVLPFVEYEGGYEILCDGNNEYTATLTCQPCEYADGACCLEDEQCQIMTAYDCYSYGGEYQGDDVSCDPNPCLKGACWFEGEGDDVIGCAEMTRSECAAVGGVYRGDGTNCSIAPPEP